MIEQPSTISGIPAPHPGGTPVSTNRTPSFVCITNMDEECRYRAVYGFTACLKHLQTGSTEVTYAEQCLSKFSISGPIWADDVQSETSSKNSQKRISANILNKLTEGKQ
jgi:hypothetical protein